MTGPMLQNEAIYGPAPENITPLGPPPPPELAGLARRRWGYFLAPFLVLLVGNYAEPRRVVALARTHHAAR